MPKAGGARVSFACIQHNETAQSACSALVDTLRYFRTLGVAFTRVMTDNGSCYRSKRFAKLCRRLKLRHIRTRPYTPRTNGKARCARSCLSQTPRTPVELTFTPVRRNSPVMRCARQVGRSRHKASIRSSIS